MACGLIRSVANEGDVGRAGAIVGTFVAAQQVIQRHVVAGRQIVERGKAGRAVERDDAAHEGGADHGAFDEALKRGGLVFGQGRFGREQSGAEHIELTEYFDAFTGLGEDRDATRTVENLRRVGEAWAVFHVVQVGIVRVEFGGAALVVVPGAALFGRGHRQAVWKDGEIGAVKAHEGLVLFRRIRARLVRAFRAITVGDEGAALEKLAFDVREITGDHGPVLLGAGPIPFAAPGHETAEDHVADLKRKPGAGHLDAHEVGLLVDQIFQAHRHEHVIVHGDGIDPIEGDVAGVPTEQLGAVTLNPTQPNTNNVYLPVGKSANHANSNITNNAGVDLDAEDDGDMGLDTAAVSGTGTMNIHHHQGHTQHRGQSAQQVTGADEDDEMDGKPVHLSRSHPEISMTTPSQSVELGHGSSIGHGGVDVRNTSLDSFSENDIVVGLSTVPNQFCTKRDAIELRKLLALSAGTRGGIVPSSSAVMDMYMVGKVVGVGSYGKVRAAWHRLTSSKVAIKTYDKSKLKDPAHWKRVHAEIKIMEQISHPRIARMYEAVETPKRMHLIMECLDGGNLCSYVKAKRRLSEDESKRIFFQIAQAIEHLHALGVSHRDVKLENVLFANDRDIKLIDFGFSTVCQPGKRLKVFCGTPSCKYYFVCITLFCGRNTLRVLSVSFSPFSWSDQRFYNFFYL